MFFGGTFMVKGLYIAGTGMITNTKKMDVIGNNLANVNTTGFKTDSVETESFNERLFSRINGSMLDFDTETLSVTQTWNSDETEVTASTTGGYFRVETENGTDYSKSVKFFKDKDGYLRTIYKNIGGEVDPLQGNLVLGSKGAIYVGDSEFSLDESGNVLIDGTVADNLITQTFPNVVGTLSAGVKGYNILTNHEQGQLEVTGNKFDLALRGDGFFNIQTNDGTYYTRDGSFTINASGELVTMDGNIVLGQNGPIYIDSDTFSINEFGEVIQNGAITEKLLMTTFSNPSDVYKIGGTLFKERNELTGDKSSFTGEVVQGALETSNADAVTEMINLIEMNRNYESSQKVINTIDELLGKAVTELGRV
jgi:flagellar basal-body rod protein FlgG